MNKKTAAPLWAATTAMVICTFAAGMVGFQKTAVAENASNLISQGASLTESFGCTGCHGSDLKGKMGPNLHESGALKQYTKAKFERAMNLGVDEQGKPFRPPMPTFHMAKGQADAIYAYLKSLK